MSSPPKPGIFITATGTGCGKTVVARALTAALCARGLRVAACKPIETGISGDPEPLAHDAIALATAAGDPTLAQHPNFYRAHPPLSPLGVTLASGQPAPRLDALSAAIADHARNRDFAVIEGAGGLLVPLDDRNTLADLAKQLAYPLLLVAPDRLGTLSHVLTAIESATSRALQLNAIVLTRLDALTDESTRSNAEILTRLTKLPVLTFPHAPNATDATLAQLAEASGLVTQTLRPNA
jgi:dethiobiotin synthetase